MLLRKSAIIGLAAIGFVSRASPIRPRRTCCRLQTLSSMCSTAEHVSSPPKDLFTHVQPTGWSIGAAAQIDNLIYVGQQGSEGLSGPRPGANIYPVYTNPGFSITVPAGTNFYQADGNPQFESTIFQTVSGLTAGTTYTLQFQQAAGQQVGFTGDTTEQWKVFLGVGGIGVNCSTNPCTVTGTANNDRDGFAADEYPVEA